MQPLDRGRQDADRERRDRRDLELGAVERERSAGGAHGPLRGQHSSARLGQEGLAGGRQADAARQPLDQIAAELALEHADLLRERRRRDACALRAAPEGALVDDCEEVFELPQVQARPVPRLGIA